MVTKLDCLARSLPDARGVVADLIERRVGLQLGVSMHDPSDPAGRLLVNVLAMVAAFKGDPNRARTREGMAVAKAKSRPRGKPPTLKTKLEAHLVALWRAGEHTTAELAERFGVVRSSIYRAAKRAGPPPAPLARPFARPRRGPQVAVESAATGRGGAAVQSNLVSAALRGAL